MLSIAPLVAVVLMGFLLLALSMLMEGLLFSNVFRWHVIFGLQTQVVRVLHQLVPFSLKAKRLAVQLINQGLLHNLGKHLVLVMHGVLGKLSAILVLPIQLLANQAYKLKFLVVQLINMGKLRKLKQVYAQILMDSQCGTHGLLQATPVHQTLNHAK